MQLLGLPSSQYFVLPIVAALLISILFLLYSFTTNGFFISVSCWFCMQRMKVIFQSRNSFICNSCGQYNGFNKDGDYNKEIKEQHQISNYKCSKPAENGLCRQCNNNMQMKVKQLAMFVPMNEANYDYEIDHFQRQLDKSYKLCKKCSLVVKRKLKKDSSWIFGNQLKHNLTFKTYTATKSVIKSKLSKVFRMCSTLLVIISLTYNLFQIDKRETIVYQFVSKTTYFDLYGKGSAFSLVLMQITLCFLRNLNLLFKLNQVLATLILVLSEALSDYPSLIVLRLFCCLYLIWANVVKDKSIVIRKITEQPSLVEEDESDFEDSLSSTSSLVSNKKNSSFGDSKTEKAVDLNESLDNLHLGSKDRSFGRPLLSPARLKTVNQNSWLAGGFWKSSDGIIFPSYISQNSNYFSSRHSVYSDSNSLCSEPQYHFQPIHNHFENLGQRFQANSCCGDCNVSFPPHYYRPMEFNRIRSPFFDQKMF